MAKKSHKKIIKKSLRRLKGGQRKRKTSKKNSKKLIKHQKQ